MKDRNSKDENLRETCALEATSPAAPPLPSLLLSSSAHELLSFYRSFFKRVCFFKYGV